MARIRNIVPVNQWPVPHRTGLELALKARRRRNRRRMCFNWREVTKNGFCKSWGRYLFWARAQEWYADAMPLCELVCAVHVADFVLQLLEVGNRPATVRHRLVGLERMMAALEPSADRGWLKAMTCDFKKTGDRRAKRIRIQLTDDLIRFAAWLADEADKLAVVNAEAGARLFQTAVQIMLLAYRPMRLKNLHELAYGPQFYRKADNMWQLDLPPSATKAGNPYDPVLPERVSILLDRFQAHRVVLGGTPYAGRLWLFGDGGPQTARSINYHICTQTKKEFTRSMCPHLFRDAVNTTVATYMPEHVRMGMNLVGNRDLACTEEHYNQAERHVAQRRYDQVLDDYEDAA
jgi:integrase/recombinase XerD